MTKYNVLLSIDELDEPFKRMRDCLERHDCNVVTANCNDFCLKGVDIFVGKKMSACQLAQADRLKAVFAYKTGADDFPLAELDKLSVPLVNSHVNSGLIAEYAFTLTLALISRIVDFDRNLRQGNWRLDNPYWDSIFDLKIGLVGYGAIGREIDRLMTRAGISTYTLNRGKSYPIPTCDTLEQLIDTCDVLILSLPKTKQTDNLFDEGTFKLMKGKYLVNVGRSNAVEEKALYHALKDGTLKGAAIDTWRQKAKSCDERLKPFDCPLETLDNIILSSHKAMQTANGHARYVEDTLKSILQYLDDGTLRNVVDLKKGY